MNILGIIITCLAALAIYGAGPAGATPPHTYLTQDFEGASFPPGGWLTEITGSAIAGGWYRAASAGDYYAHGYLTGPYPSWGDTYLLTSTLSFQANTRLKLGFYRYNSGQGTVPFTFSAVIRRGETEVWSEAISYSPSWGWVEFTPPALSAAANDYRFGWHINAVMGPSSGGNVHLHMDDVIITENNIGVAPAFFGRVKALFR
jgi:hypothetical protein